MNKKSKIYIAGHNGLVGSAILRKLKNEGYKNLIFKSRNQLDLTNQNKVYNFLLNQKPDFIFIAAAKVGGILANYTKKADFIRDNLFIQTNLIHGAFLSGVKRLIFLGSSCVYPRNCKQPIKEEYLLSGKLEESNDAYAIAKIAGIKMCKSYNQQYKVNYTCLMPTNTFGPKDNYDLSDSHFLPALIKKIYMLKKKKLKNLILWGNGKAKRELIYVDDLADACVFFMKKKTKHSLINIGTGKDYTIKHYTNLIANLILKKKILIKYDHTKPNGTPRKVLDVSLARNYGWVAKCKLEDSILKCYSSFLSENN